MLREILLLKLRDTDATQVVLGILTSEYAGKVVDHSNGAIVVEITGSYKKIDRAIQAVPNGVIHELVRSGALGIAAGKTVLKLESMRV